jgi:flagellar biosynthesis GTPase FlhF
MFRKIVAIAVILGFCGVIMAGDRPTMPAGMKGFAGMFECTLIEKTDRGLVVKITAIKEVWKHSKAENPRSGIGCTVLVIPRSTKARDGKFYPDENLVKFMRLVKKGDTLVLDVKQDGEVFVLLELTKEQKERLAGVKGDKEREVKKEEGEKEQPREREKAKENRDGDKEAREREKVKENRDGDKEAREREEKEARERKEKEARERENKEGEPRKEEPRDNEKNKEETSKPRENNLPEGAKGFSGMLEGEVLGKVENGFILKVTKVIKVWRNNKAENAESLVGMEVVINVKWEKGQDGNWHPVEAQIRYVRSLEKGATIQIEVINDEGNRLHIGELSKEQREKGQEKEKDKEEDI